jgi:hypothetical protein
MASQTHSANLLLKLTVATHNGRLHIKLHYQIMYVPDTLLRSRY